MSTNDQTNGAITGTFGGRRPVYNGSAVPTLEEAVSSPWFVTRMRCPACDSEQHRTKYRCAYDERPISDYLTAFYENRIAPDSERLSGAEYVLVECGECGLVYQREVPNDALMERLYEHWIASDAPSETDEETLARRERYALEITRALTYFGHPAAPLRTLDFGMGWGEWALVAKTYGCDSYGTELSERRIEHARDNGIKIVGSVEIRSMGFDFINTEQVLEHVAQPLATLRLLASALADGGIIRISVPDGTGIDRRLLRMDWDAPRGSRDSLNPVAPLEHINCFARATLLRMAEEASMREVTFPLRVQYAGRSRGGGVRGTIEEALRPLYRAVIKRPDCVLLRNA